MSASPSPAEAGTASPVPAWRGDWLPEHRSFRHLTGWAAIRSVVTDRTSRRWYLGAVLSLSFIVGYIVPLVLGDASPAQLGFTVAWLVLFSLCYVLSVPLAAALPERWQWTAPAALLLLSLPILLVEGSGTLGLWIYVAMVSVATLPTRAGLLAVALLALAAFGIGLLQPVQGLDAWAIPLILAASGLMMVAFVRNLRTLRLLRATQRELARVAVEEERNRVGRDMHDVLGHSLSAIAVKADLAAALADRDPHRAGQEIRDVQTLARSTLGDLRAVVSGYRQVRIAGELASIRTLLPAAGIAGHLPVTTDMVPEAQRELAHVAVEEERNRVGRDMHDILGHSLSAIAVKADLAAALADRDPHRAGQEIREVQTLARSTLGDLRAVVSGYRQVRIAGELASIRTLLPAAGITGHLPVTTDMVPEAQRELFGWTLREAVTNVIRHAGATGCWVSLEPHRIVVEDDGVGPGAYTAGNGLAGLAERVADGDGVLRIGRSPQHGGFRIEVTA